MNTVAFIGVASSHRLASIAFIHVAFFIAILLTFGITRSGRQQFRKLFKRAFLLGIVSGLIFCGCVLAVLGNSSVALFDVAIWCGTLSVVAFVDSFCITLFVSWSVHIKNTDGHDTAIERQANSERDD